jgi:hypothetical protein
MYYKIQPEQIQIHTFSSPSGDINFLAGTNYVYGDLSRSLTGNFNFVGSLSINGLKIQSSDASNYLSGANSFILGGLNNDVTGIKNIAINSESSTIGGNNNSIINSRFSSIDPTSKNSTIIGGAYASILPTTTGTMMLKDNVASSEQTNLSNSLIISFQGGNFIKQGGLTVEVGDLKLSNISSGLFSGDIKVLGNTYLTGAVQALGNTSFGIRPTVNGTGVLLQGEGAVDPSQVVMLTGDQIIGGIKDFNARPKVGGVNVALVGDINGGDGTNLVTTDTEQTISGNKIFTQPIRINSTQNHLVFSTGSPGNTISIIGPTTYNGDYIYRVPNVGNNAAFVMTTGTQTIGGDKTFTSRPNVNGSGVALQGEVASPSNFVDLTTNQSIGGLKNFSTRPQVNGINVLLSGEGAGGGEIDVTNLVTTNSQQTISSLKDFTIRPTLNGTGFLLSGEASEINTTNLVNTNVADQQIIARKIFTQDILMSGSTQKFSLVSSNAPANSININIPNLVSNSTTYTIPALSVSADFVMNSGSQTIGGLKYFTTRPTVNGSGVILSGEVPSASNFVDITTNQTVGGSKIFTSGPTIQVAGNQITLKTGPSSNSMHIKSPGTIDNNCTYTIPYVATSASFVMSTGTQDVGGLKKFTTRPTVTGTNVALTSDIPNTSSFINGDGSVVSIISLTQAEYDGLPTKVATTLYIIT